MHFWASVFLLNLFGRIFAAPIPQSASGGASGGAPPAGAAPPGGAPGGMPGGLPLPFPIHALPHSGIVGAADNLGAGIANFGNGQGSSFDAFISGFFNAIGTLVSGVLGSGAVNTAFLNYNNRPPPALVSFQLFFYLHAI